MFTCSIHVYLQGAPWHSTVSVTASLADLANCSEIGILLLQVFVDLQQEYANLSAAALAAAKQY